MRYITLVYSIPCVAITIIIIVLVTINSRCSIRHNVIMSASAPHYRPLSYSCRAFCPSACSLAGWSCVLLLFTRHLNWHDAPAACMFVVKSVRLTISTSFTAVTGDHQHSQWNRHRHPLVVDNNNKSREIDSAVHYKWLCKSTPFVSLAVNPRTNNEEETRSYHCCNKLHAKQLSNDNVRLHTNRGGATQMYAIPRIFL